MIKKYFNILIIKSIVYRIIRIVLLFATTYLVLGDISSAISISIIDTIIATIYYYYFEKMWNSFIRRYSS